MKVWIDDGIRKTDLDRGLHAAGLRLDGTRRKDGSWNTVRLEAGARQVCEHGTCTAPASATLGGARLCSAHAVERMRELRDTKRGQDWDGDAWAAR